MRPDCSIEESESFILKNIIVSKGFQQLIIPIQEILYFFYENKSVFAVTAENHIFHCEMGLSEIEKSSCSSFFRINRQMIVNYSAIQSFSYIENNKIKLSVMYGRDNAILGKNRVAEFKKWIMFGCSCVKTTAKADFYSAISPNKRMGKQVSAPKIISLK